MILHPRKRGFDRGHEGLGAEVGPLSLKQHLDSPLPPVLPYLTSAPTLRRSTTALVDVTADGTGSN